MDLVKLQHIFREGNEIVEKLVAMGWQSTNMQIQIMETVSDTLKELLTFDIGQDTEI